VQPGAGDQQILGRQFVPSRDHAGVEVCPRRLQRGFERRGQTRIGIVAAGHQQHPRAGEVWCGRAFQHLDSAQKDRLPDRAGMQAQDRAQEVRAVGIAQERRARRVQAQPRKLAFDEFDEILRLGADMVLIVGHRVEAAEPAVDALFVRPATDAQQPGMRAEPPGQRHQVGFIAAGPVQQDDHRPIGFVRHQKAVSKARIAHSCIPSPFPRGDESILRPPDRPAFACRH